MIGDVFVRTHACARRHTHTRVGNHRLMDKEGSHEQTRRGDTQTDKEGTYGQTRMGRTDRRGGDTRTDKEGTYGQIRRGHTDRQGGGARTHGRTDEEGTHVACSGSELWTSKSKFSMQRATLLRIEALTAPIGLVNTLTQVITHIMAIPELEGKAELEPIQLQKMLISLHIAALGTPNDP